MGSGKTLCSVVRKQFTSLVGTLNDIELAYMPPKRNTAGNRTRLTGLNLTMKGLVQLRGIVQQLQTGSVVDFPAVDYLNELNFFRQRAVDTTEMFSRAPNSVHSWTDFYERSRGAYSRVRKAVKISDLVGAGISLGAAYYLDQKDYSINEGLIAAAMLYSLDFLRTKGQTDSWARIGAVTAASLPVLGALASYLTSDNASWQSVKDLFLTPANLMAFAHIPAMLYVKTRLDVNDYLDGQRLASAPDSVGDFFERTRKLSYTLAEVLRLQRIDGINGNAPDDMLQNFEKACVDYLNGTGKKENIRLARLKVRGHYSKKAQASGVQSPAIQDETNGAIEQSHSILTALTAKFSPESEHDLESRTLGAKEVQASIGDLRTFNLAIDHGVDRDLALKISHQVSYKNTSGVVERLTTIVGQDYRSLVAANPNLLAMDREKSEAYFRNLSAVLGRIAQYGERAPQNFIVSNNPIAFASLDGLTGLNREMDRLSESPIKPIDPLEAKYSGALRAAGYNNFELLKVLLVHGFRLESSRPRIGMAYSRFAHIKRGTRPAAGQEQMTYFDDIFGRLISDGVILLDKTYKLGGSGGRFPGCYSLNPRLEEIMSPELREFVADCMYSKLRNGNGNGNGK